MSRKLETATVNAHQPRFQDGEFMQAFTLRTPVRISRGAIQQLTEAIASQFKRTIELNKIASHAWPPTRINITPHADFKGLECTMGTKSTVPGGTILQIRH